jgi:hypothetical protein
MGANYESPDNLQSNADDIIFIYFIFLDKPLRFHYFRKNNFFPSQTSNFFTKIGVLKLLNVLDNKPMTKIF